MAEIVKHECGIALLKFFKPKEFYTAKYGDSFYGMHTMQKLMHHQRHRGQDGAGIVYSNIPSNTSQRTFIQFRSALPNGLSLIFKKLEPCIQKQASSITESFLGHLRYGTYGKQGLSYCHPFIRKGEKDVNTLAIAGNFNLTNMQDVFNHHLHKNLSNASDTRGILEIITHHLDLAFLQEGKIDINNIMSDACQLWDGGYVISGIAQNGQAFVVRDPSAIRPAYYVINEEVFAVASERYAIHEALGIAYEHILEVPAGYVVSVDDKQNAKESQLFSKTEKKSCSFERIYFSHKKDPQIKSERERLGALLLPKISEKISLQSEDNIFSFVPQTAQTAFEGLLNRIDLNRDKKNSKALTLSISEKKTHLRLFLSDEKNRNNLLHHAFKNTDLKENLEGKNLILIDDSIVRGNTLKHGILESIAKLNPAQVIIASSAPQVRYPDCYGIDIARMDELIAFKAAIELLKEKGLESLISHTYEICLNAKKNKNLHLQNHVSALYAVLHENEISKKISEMIKPPSMQSELHILFQSLEDLHQACPNHIGDWYFSGQYPSPGGNRVVNESFINFIEGNLSRAY